MADVRCRRSHILGRCQRILRTLKFSNFFNYASLADEILIHTLLFYKLQNANWLSLLQEKSIFWFSNNWVVEFLTLEDYSHIYAFIYVYNLHDLVQHTHIKNKCLLFVNFNIVLNRAQTQLLETVRPCTALLNRFEWVEITVIMNAQATTVRSCFLIVLLSYNIRTKEQFNFKTSV